MNNITKLLRRRFTFSDIVFLDDRSIQTFLKETDVSLMEMAFYSAPTEILDRIFCNMSRRAAAMLKECMEYRAPVMTLSEIRKARRAVEELLKKLESDGKIKLPKLTRADNPKKVFCTCVQ